MEATKAMQRGAAATARYVHVRNTQVDDANYREYILDSLKGNRKSPRQLYID